ncbi:hypothetical protein PR048_016438 [Dryococelus australis]|uniref:Uncharacterized protein n=1 Tax=Dryococelus australis TaxID=614101 RepID=A0ABQ9HJP7_9NEOP|nr:hypothetical protein PR048_016438 [Dryococelus australis]
MTPKISRLDYFPCIDIGLPDRPNCNIVDDFTVWTVTIDDVKYNPSMLDTAPACGMQLHGQKHLARCGGSSSWPRRLEVRILNVVAGRIGQRRGRFSELSRVLIPTRANHARFPTVSISVFASGNRAGRYRWPVGFLGDLPFPPSLHSGTAPYSPRLTLVDFDDLVVMGRPHLSTSHACCRLVGSKDLPHGIHSEPAAGELPLKTSQAGPRRLLVLVRRWGRGKARRGESRRRASRPDGRPRARMYDCRTPFLLGAARVPRLANYRKAVDALNEPLDAKRTLRRAGCSRADFPDYSLTRQQNGVAYQQHVANQRLITYLPADHSANREHAVASQTRCLVTRAVYSQSANRYAHIKGTARACDACSLLCDNYEFIVCCKPTNLSNTATGAERLTCPPPTKANRVQFPAESLPDFCMCESCRSMPLVGGFSRGSPVLPRPFIPALLHTHLNQPLNHPYCKPPFTNSDTCVNICCFAFLSNRLRSLSQAWSPVDARCPEADRPTIVGRCASHPDYCGTVAAGVSTGPTHAPLKTRQGSGLCLDMVEAVLATRAVCGMQFSCWNSGSGILAINGRIWRHRNMDPHGAGHIACRGESVLLDGEIGIFIWDPPHTGAMIISPHDEAALTTKHQTSPVSVCGVPHCSGLSPLQTEPPLLHNGSTHNGRWGSGFTSGRHREKLSWDTGVLTLASIVERVTSDPSASALDSMARTIHMGGYTAIDYSAVFSPIVRSLSKSANCMNVDIAPEIAILLADQTVSLRTSGKARCEMRTTYLSLLSSNEEVAKRHNSLATTLALCHATPGPWQRAVAMAEATRPSEKPTSHAI